MNDPLTITWDVDPVMVHIPRAAVLGIMGATALLQLVIGLNKKSRESLTSAALVGALAFVAWGFMEDSWELRYYPMIFMVVFVGGRALMNWQITRGGGQRNEADLFIMYGVLGVILGARFGHVLFYNLDKALADPLWVLQIWRGGLASHGATIGLTLAMFLFCRRRGVSFIEGADRFVFSAALGATLVRLGNLLNSEIVGRPTGGDWGFYFVRADGLDGPLRHPSQLYEICLGLTVMLALYVADRALGKEKRPRGAMISLFFLLYFSGRFAVEFFKAHHTLPDSWPLTMGQLLSLPGIMLGLGGLIVSLRRRVPVGWTPAADQDVTASSGRADHPPPTPA